MIRKIVIISIIIILIPLFSLAQTKRALIIGLGKQEDPTWNKINGDKDVPYILEILHNANYEQIISLVNEDACKWNIVNAFQLLEQSCQSGDIIYIHFSGHGQQMDDSDNDEMDLLDECWIPYDAYLTPCDNYNGEKHLLDDEINIFLTNIRNKIGNNGKILVVVDACHSGGSTRGTKGEITRGASSIFNTIKSKLYTNNPKRDINENSMAEPWITLTACASDQVNTEMRSPVVGKLTYALYNVITAGFSSNDDFFRQLQMFVNYNSSSRPQNPTMTGEIGSCSIADILY